MEGLRESREPSEDWHDSEAECHEDPAIAVVHYDVSSETSKPTSEPWRNEILTLASVMKATGLKRSTIYTKITAGSFPQQFAIHGSRVGWRRGEVQDWLDALTR